MKKTKKMRKKKDKKIKEKKLRMKSKKWLNKEKKIKEKETHLMMRIMIIEDFYLLISNYFEKNIIVIKCQIDVWYFMIKNEILEDIQKND